MKIYNLLYILSIIFLVISIVLIVWYSNSGRMHLIAGMSAALGFSFNIAAFVIKKG